MTIGEGKKGGGGGGGAAAPRVPAIKDLSGECTEKTTSFVDRFC